MKSLTKNSVWNMIYQAANVVFPLLSYMYVSRILLADGVGRVADVQNTVAYFTAVASLGLPEHAIRSIARVKEDIQDRNKVFTELLLLNTLFTTIAVVLYLICVLSIPGMKQDLPLYFGCGALIVFNYFNIDWFFQGMEEYTYIVGRNLIVKILFVLSLFVFVRSERDILLYALISTLAMGGNHVVNIFYVRKFARISFRKLDLRRHMKPIVMLMAATLLGSIYHQVDITMLGILQSDVSVGHYVYGSKIILIAVQICNAVPLVFMPRLVYFYYNDKKKFEELISTGIQVLFFLAVPISAGMFVLASEIVGLLFGEAFLPVATTIRCLSLTIIIRSFGNLLCYQLMLCTGNEKKRLPAYAAAALANVALNAVLIPRMAENGAAIATVVSELIVNGYQLNYVRRQINIRFSRRALVQSVASTALMTAGIVLVRQLVPGKITGLLLAFSAGCVLYLSMNLIMKNDLMRMIFYRIKHDRIL